MNDRHYISWLAPVAAVIAAPAYAATYFTVPQAQAALFPSQTMTEVAFSLTPQQIKQIEKASGTKVREKNPKVWKASGGGWFYLDQVIGKHEFITYGLALNADGTVSGVEILDYRETYGSEVRNPKWRAQFVGKRLGAPLKLDIDIINLSGATLSSRNIATGVRRLLNTHAYVAN
jgi:Na+-translocating ferredoxin:NAD+ oxidoreductase RnfG subunit